MCFCCSIIGQLHVENEKDQPPLLRLAHTFLYFSCKLSIIIAIAATMFDFLKILNMGFGCTIKGNLHAKNQNDPPNRFRAAQPVTEGRTDRQGESEMFYRKLPGGNNHLLHMMQNKTPLNLPIFQYLYYTGISIKKH